MINEWVDFIEKVEQFIESLGLTEYFTTDVGGETPLL